MTKSIATGSERASSGPLLARAERIERHSRLLLALCSELRVTQESLADACGIVRSRVAKWLSYKLKDRKAGT